jgi:hypothetical protein
MAVCEESQVWPIWMKAGGSFGPAYLISVAGVGGI